MGMNIKITYTCDNCGKIIKDPLDASMLIDHTENYYFHSEECMKRWPQYEEFKRYWATSQPTKTVKGLYNAEV